MSDVLDLPFDQFQRYELVHALLESVRAAGESFTVLDVGGRTALLRSFLPDDRVELVDVDPSDAEGLILGSGAELPFRDDAFDVVAAFDTLEHVPPDLRADFVAECGRVARRYVILAGPYDSPRVAEAEEILLDFLQRRLQWEHRYLKEHREHGLPSAGETVEGLRAAGARVETFGHGALDRWLVLMAIELYVEHETLLRDIAPRMYRLYNEHLFASDRGDDVYRHAIVAAFGDAPMPDLERALGPVQPTPPEATRAFLAIGEEFARYDVLRDTYEPEMARLHGVVADVVKDLTGHRETIEILHEDLRQTKLSLQAVSADLTESKKTIEALRAASERERGEVAKILVEKDNTIGVLGAELDAHRVVVEELRRQHEAEAREIEVRGAALDELRGEHNRLHESLFEALSRATAFGERETRLRSDLSEALSGAEDRSLREQLLAAQELTVEEELSLLIDARDRRLRERDEARDQLMAMAAELAREQERRAQLVPHVMTLGARLWRAITLRPLDPDLLDD